MPPSTPLHLTNTLQMAAFSSEASGSSSPTPQEASASARTSTDNAPTPRRIKASERQYQSEMMFIGQRCHWHECHREDFLPFRCADCHEHFCSNHFRSEQHSCPKKQDSYVVPLCPLCHEPPKSWKRDEDPNVAMDAHLSPNRKTGLVECTAIDSNGRVHNSQGTQKTNREKKPNVCSERRCTKLMVVPIECPSCHHKFCPSHRAPNQHECLDPGKAKPQPRAQASQTASSWQPSKFLNLWSASTESKRDPESSESPSAKSSGKPHNPVKALGNAALNFRDDRKLDKRAREERASAIKAMQARRAKGLLTKAEEVRLAEEMAKMHASDSTSSETRRLGDRFHWLNRK